jgi:hypothetical protein
MWKVMHGLIEVIVRPSEFESTKAIAPIAVKRPLGLKLDAPLRNSIKLNRVAAPRCWV